jgi:hypothetical protein
MIYGMGNSTLETPSGIGEDEEGNGSSLGLPSLKKGPSKKLKRLGNGFRLLMFQKRRMKFKWQSNIIATSEHLTFQQRDREKIFVWMRHYIRRLAIT